MYSRLIRAELFDSERFVGLHDDSHRLLYIAFVLRADDFGNFEGATRKLFRWTQNFTQIKNESGIVSALSALCDADLLRRYEVDGKVFFHIPRFKSTRRYTSRKWPLSPWCDLNTKSSIEQKQDFRIKSAAVLRQVCGPSAADLPRGVGVGVGVGLGWGWVGVGVGVGERQNIFVEPDGSTGDLVLESNKEHATGNCPFEKLNDLWKRYCAALPQMAAWSDTRRAHVRARWRQAWVEGKWESEQQGLDWFAGLFQTVAASKFLTGRVPSKDRKPFVCTFDWLMKPENFLKVLEGKYS